MLDQLKLLANNLTKRQMILIAITALVIASGLGFLILKNRDRDFQPVYTGLAAEDAGQIVNRLKESNVEYRLGDNGSTILVRSAKAAEVRLNLAGSGLPKSGRIGFELFDKTNFGISDFTEQVNYRRALEGELERSISSINEVEQSRVHLTFAKESVFTESRQPAKASVLVKLKNGAELSKKNVLAIEHLVANAVQGLTAENVSIVDMKGNLLSRRNQGGDAEDGYKQNLIEYRQRIEKSLLANIYSTLEPVLGAEHFRAGVSVDVDYSSGEQSEETFDPDRSVMVSQQRSEETNIPNAASGVPGTPSNLPRPTSRPGSSTSAITRRTENIAYQTSRTVRRTKLPDGAIRRISVSAILDQNVRWEGTGAKARRILEPPSEETLKKVRDLISGAVGFNPERGDQLIVQSLPFEGTLRANPPPPDPSSSKPSPGDSPISQWLASRNITLSPMLAGAAIGGLLLFLFLAGGIFLFLRRKRKSARAASVDIQHALPSAEPQPSAIAESSDDGDVVKLHSSSEEHPTHADGGAEAMARAEADLLRSMRVPELTTKKAEVLVKHITEQAKREPVAMAQLIRSWLAEKERR
jgi:flagellar M-ring protein FliF